VDLSRGIRFSPRAPHRHRSRAPARTRVPQRLRGRLR
jgi:hypothetical protein